MEIHPLVQQVVDAYLAAVDAEVPDLVQGVYLVGSVALDDFRPRASDIDFGAVTESPLSEPDIVALERVHVALAARHRRPFFDGEYVTWRDLAGEPAVAGPGAGAHEGRLHRRDGGCDPVGWHTLAGHGVAVRGPNRADVRVWTDRTTLAAWTHQNLDDYWTVWLRRSSRLLSRPGLASVHPWGPGWGVLGVSRMHYTLATGAVTSKHGAGLYARETFDPRWRRIIDECLRLRGGEHHGRALYRNPLTRRREALDFVAMAIGDAHRIG